AWADARIRLEQVALLLRGRPAFRRDRLREWIDPPGNPRPHPWRRHVLHAGMAERRRAAAAVARWGLRRVLARGRRDDRVFSAFCAGRAPGRPQLADAIFRWAASRGEDAGVVKNHRQLK